MRRILSVLAVSAILSILADNPRASLIHVPADVGTIQAAIDLAGASDTVVVAPGIYVENVKVEGKTVSLVSQFVLDGNPEHIRETVIDGSNPSQPDSASIIRLVNAGNSLVQGFTLTGGSGTIWRDQTDMHLYREGGAILSEGGTPRIFDNVMIANRASDTTGVESAGGGAIRCGYGSVQIRNNIFAYNNARYGGAVMLFKNVGVIKNNIFYRNSGGEHFGGGAVYSLLSPSTQLIENNTLIENHSALDGGGILLWFNAATVAGNILWGNTASFDPQIGLRQGAAFSAVDYCDVEGGYAGTDNISLPALYDPLTFHLDPLSPCVDVGNPATGSWDPPDPGDTTLALAPALGARRNDMGAFGGPGMHDLPLFNSPGIALEVSSVDFGTVTAPSSGTFWLRYSKADFGFVRIDSVRIDGDPLGTVTVQTPIPASLGPARADSLDSILVVWTTGDYGMLDDTLYLYHNDITVASPFVVTLSGFSPGTTGDVNFDGVLNSGDIIYLVNYAFKGGPAPKPVSRSGDVNCDGNVTSADIIFMVNYVFKSGAPPCS